MSISSLRHRILKRVELQQFKTDYADIGSFIKRKRKELNVTQDEISNGICSISYLSKIENNQIVPSEFYVKEIMEKLDIEEAIYTKSLQDKTYVKKMIEGFFYLDDELIETIYNDIREVEHNLIINLCKLGYNVYFQKPDDNQYVMMLEHLITNMNDLSVQLYLYFSSLFFIQNHKYKTALELIVLQETLPQQNDYLIALFSELSYLVKQRLHIKNSALDDYQHAMTYYTKYHNTKRIIQMAFLKVNGLILEHPQKALKMLDSMKPNLMSATEMDQYFYLKASLYHKLKQYNDALFALKHIDSQSLFYMRKMTLLLEICTIEQDTDMIAEIKRVMSEYVPHPFEISEKIHYHYLVQESEEDRKTYLREIAIPFSIKTENYKQLETYTTEIMKICTDNSRYKEAMQHYNRLQKERHKALHILY